MYKNFITITPLLTPEELHIFSLFNDICELNMDNKSKVNSIWLNSQNGNLEDGFEVINPRNKQDNIKEKLNEKIEQMSFYSCSHFFSENLLIISNYKDLFLKTTLQHVHGNNYKICGNVNNLNHLIKVIHMFHANGFLNRFLHLNITHHHFNSVIVNEATGDSFILDNTSIYRAYLAPSGMYQKQDELTSEFLEDLLNTIDKKICQDSLSQNLPLKKQNTIIKI